MKPVPFVASLVPAAALAALAAATSGQVSWAGAGGLFYGELIVAELAYLGIVFARGGAQDRSA